MKVEAYHKAIKPQPKIIEGPDAFTNCKNAMRVILSVPHSVIQRRLKEHLAEVEANPNRRGPKHKPKTSAPA